MIIFSLIIFILLVLSLGWLVLLFWPEKDRIAALALSFILGGGMMSLQLFIARFILRLELGNWCVWLFLLEVLALFFYHHKQGKQPLPIFKTDMVFSKVDLTLITLIAGAVILSLIRVWTHPLVTFDALAVWAYRVKILYYHQPDLFNPDTVSFWATLNKVNYPWHLSLLGWLQAHLTGGVSETLINFLPWCYYSSLLLSIYAMAKDKLSRMWSLALVLAVATMPLVFYHSYNFYADLPLASCLAAVCLVWRRWLSNKSASALSLALLLSGLALLIKTEAIFFVGALITLSIFRIYQNRLQKNYLWLAFITCIIALPWFGWLAANHLGVSNVAPGLGWHPQVISNIFLGLFIAQSWHIWWYIVIIMAAVSWGTVSKENIFRYNLAWFVLSFSLFLILYFFTETYQFVLDNSALSRNYILFIPLSVGLAIDCLSAWFKDV